MLGLPGVDEIPINAQVLGPRVSEGVDQVCGVGLMGQVGQGRGQAFAREPGVARAGLEIGFVNGRI